MGKLFVQVERVEDLTGMVDDYFTQPKQKQKPITNADCIRAMTDEELAELFANNNCGYCRIHDFCFAKGIAINCEDAWFDWLKHEVNE